MGSQKASQQFSGRSPEEDVSWTDKIIFRSCTMPMWPGLVGKGPDSEPPIGLDEMLAITAAAEVDSIKFDRVDLFLAEPYTSIDWSSDDIKKLANKIEQNLEVGSVVAPVWPPAGGGSAMGDEADRKRFVEMVRKAFHIGKQLREFDVRNGGVVRIDSAASVGLGQGSHRQYPHNCQHLPASLRCRRGQWRASRRRGRNLLGRHAQLAGHGRPFAAGRPAENIGLPGRHGAHFALDARLAPEARILPADFDWKQREVLDAALKKLTDALRPRTIDFHVVQNDTTVKGLGSHDTTGRHCLVNDPDGKFDVVRVAGYWVRDTSGKPTRAIRHICWNGCIFPNSVMRQPQTWNDVLKATVDVRDAQGRRQ
jgi:hypothetical protein